MESMKPETFAETLHAYLYFISLAFITPIIIFASLLLEKKSLEIGPISIVILLIAAILLTATIDLKKRNDPFKSATHKGPLFATLNTLNFFFTALLFPERIEERKIKRMKINDIPEDKPNCINYYIHVFQIFLNTSILFSCILLILLLRLLDLLLVFIVIMLGITVFSFYITKKIRPFLIAIFDVIDEFHIGLAVLLTFTLFFLIFSPFLVINIFGNDATVKINNVEYTVGALTLSSIIVHISLIVAAITFLVEVLFLLRYNRRNFWLAFYLLALSFLFFYIQPNFFGDKSMFEFVIMVSSGVSLVYMLKDIKKRIEQGLLYSALSFSYAFLEQKNIFIIFAVLSLLFLFVLYNAYKRYKENKEVLVY